MYLEECNIASLEVVPTMWTYNLIRTQHINPKLKVPKTDELALLKGSKVIKESIAWRLAVERETMRCMVWGGLTPGTMVYRPQSTLSLMLLH